jgi:peptidoglycan/xylan/chitin deacetylase (PgdA/CDA1 family)
MTLDQLRALQISGWEIAAHDTPNFDGQTADTLTAQLAVLRKWYSDNGFAVGAQNVAYPGGGFDANSLDVIRKTFTTGRTIGDNVNHETWPPGDRLLLRDIEVVNTTTTAALSTAITAAAANKTWLIINFHNIVTTPGVATEYSTANFTTFIAALAASGIAVSDR